MSQTVRLIGIDFGTSTSVVKVKRYRGEKPIGDSYITGGVTFGNGDADTKASTIARRNGDGSLTCGADAAEAVPNSTIFREFKMELEDRDPEKRQQARELTAAFFRYLYERYDHQRSDLGEIDDEERTLVSLPVKWGEETRQFMARAAEKAGFKRVAVMDEPTAALYATLCRKMNEINQHGLLRAGESGYLLLADMGAGTTDLAVCRYTVDSSPGEVIRADRIKNEIVAAWPEDRNAATFGGREVDRVLEDYVEAYLRECGLPDAMAAQMVRGAASNSAKLWKETAVSKNLNEGKRVETCAFVSGYMAFLPQQKPFPAFGRSEFEGMLGNRLEQFGGLVAGCLRRASELEPEVLGKGLDLVILTGGHSSWYFTEELLNGTMPGLELPQLERVQREKSRVIRLTNPQETVALGLVYSRLPFQVGKKEEPKPKPRPERKEAGYARQTSDGISADTRLHPAQVKVLTVTDRAARYAADVAEKLNAQGLRAEVDARDEGIGQKIREAMLEDISYMLVVGERDMDTRTVSVRHRSGGDLGSMSLGAFAAMLQREPEQETKPSVETKDPGDSGVPHEFPDKLTEEQFELVRKFFSVPAPGMQCSVASNAVILSYFKTNVASGTIRVDQDGFKVKYADSKADVTAIPSRESHHEHISWGEFLRGEISVVQPAVPDMLFGFHGMVAIRFERDGETVQKHLARAAVSLHYDNLDSIQVVMKLLQTSIRGSLRY